MQLGKFTAEDIQLINLFEKEFKARVVDYFNDRNSVAFVVQTANFRALIGKGGSNIRQLQEKIHTQVRVFQYEEDVVAFARNLAIVPVKHIEITEKQGKKTLSYEVEPKNKALLIGREGKHIALIKTFLKRQYNIERVVVA